MEECVYISGASREVQILILDGKIAEAERLIQKEKGCSAMLADDICQRLVSQLSETNPDFCPQSIKRPKSVFMSDELHASLTKVAGLIILVGVVSIGMTICTPSSDSRKRTNPSFAPSDPRTQYGWTKSEYKSVISGIAWSEQKITKKYGSQWGDFYKDQVQSRLIGTSYDEAISLIYSMRDEYLAQLANEYGH